MCAEIPMLRNLSMFILEANWFYTDLNRDFLIIPSPFNIIYNRRYLYID
jgi:hypothetical protein